jgi:hypothetical protein
MQSPVDSYVTDSARRGDGSATGTLQGPAVFWHTVGLANQLVSGRDCYRRTAPPATAGSFWDI